MPLARYAVYRGGPQIWLAPTADDSDGWLASMRHIAIESGAFVVSVPQYIPGAAFPDDFPVADRPRAHLRARRRGDRRAVGRQRARGAAVRPRGHGRGRLRPARGAAREALLRRRRALLARGRAAALVDARRPRRAGGAWCRSRRGTSGRGRRRRSCSGCLASARLEHLERVEVEVVGRLVEQQQVGLGGDDARRSPRGRAGRG